MCDRRQCSHQAGEQELLCCNQTLQPGEVLFAQDSVPANLRFGVMVNSAAWQWEIVAVESGRSRHVAFISTIYRLDQVLNLAGRMSLGMISA